MFDDHIERELLVYISEADRKHFFPLGHPYNDRRPLGAIKKGRQRLGDEPTHDDVKIDANHPELLRIQVLSSHDSTVAVFSPSHQAQMDKVLAEVERAGESGDIDAALMLMQNVDSLDAAREKLLNTGKADPSADPNNKKLRVCDVCGSYLSVYDSDKRLADHFLGMSFHSH